MERALTKSHYIHSSQEGPSFEIKAGEVQLLAEGGYNYVWLVSYTAEYHVNGYALFLSFD